MNSIINVTRQFIRDENGATAVEYALMAALIAGVIAGAVTLLGTTVRGAFNTVQAAM